MKKLILIIMLCSSWQACRTPETKDKRVFPGKRSSGSEVVAVSKTKAPPATPPNTPLPSPLPDPQGASDSLQDGVFFLICEARDQLPSAERLTVSAVLRATHQVDCEQAEKWLRDPRNTSLFIEKDRLIELRTLMLLKNFPHIRHVYITIAKGVDPICPLQGQQLCHFKIPLDES